MRPIYVVYDRSSQIRFREQIDRAVFNAADVFPATEFKIMGTSYHGVSTDSVLERAGKRVAPGGREQRNLYDIINELRAAVGDRSTVVLAIVGADLYYWGADEWGFVENTCGRQSENIIVLSWNQYAFLSLPTFQKCLSHVVRRELGHLYRVAEGRRDSAGRRFFDDHCTNPDCDMYQTSGGIQNVIDLAERVSQQQHCFCDRCRSDLSSRAYRWSPDVGEASTVTWLIGGNGL